MNQTAIEMFSMQRAFQPFVGIVYSMVRHSPSGTVLELGTGTQFQSTRTMLGAISDRGSGHLTSVDISAKWCKVSEENKANWTFVKGNTHDQKTKTEAEVNGPFDILLIDAGHLRDDVEKDFNDYSCLVSPGGYIICHDVLNGDERYPDGGVKAWWDALVWEGERLTVQPWPGLGILHKPNL